MRIPHQEQYTLDCPAVDQVELNADCRDRMIPILRGLQHLYSLPDLRDQVIDLVADDVLDDVDPDRGREGLTLWQIVVLAAVRMGTRTDPRKKSLKVFRARKVMTLDQLARHLACSHRTVHRRLKQWQAINS